MVYVPLALPRGQKQIQGLPGRAGPSDLYVIDLAGCDESQIQQATTLFAEMEHLGARFLSLPPLLSRALQGSSGVQLPLVAELPVSPQVFLHGSHPRVATDMEERLTTEIDHALRAMMEDSQAVARLEDYHFYTPGDRHFEPYLKADQLMSDRPSLRYIGEQLTLRLFQRLPPPDVVLGWARTGLLLASEVRDQLYNLYASLYPQPMEMGLHFSDPAPDHYRPHFTDTVTAALRNRRVLVVVDVLSTLETVTQLLELIRAAGGEPIGVGAAVRFDCPRLSKLILGLNRGGLVVETVATLPGSRTYDRDDCPFCRNGSRRELLHTAAGWLAKNIPAPPALERALQPSPVLITRGLRWADFFLLCAKVHALGKLENDGIGLCEHHHHGLFIDFSLLALGPREITQQVLSALVEAATEFQKTVGTIDYVLHSEPVAAAQLGRHLADSLGVHGLAQVRVGAAEEVQFRGEPGGVLPQTVENVLLVDDCSVTGNTCGIILTWLKTQPVVKRIGVVELVYGVGHARHTRLSDELASKGASLAALLDLGFLWWSPSRCPMCDRRNWWKDLQETRKASARFGRFLRQSTDEGTEVTLNYVQRASRWDLPFRCSAQDQDGLLDEFRRFSAEVEQHFWSASQRLGHLVVVIALVSRLDEQHITTFFTDWFGRPPNDRTATWILSAALDALSLQQLRALMRPTSRDGKSQLQRFYETAVVSQSSSEEVLASLFSALWDGGDRREENFVTVVTRVKSDSSYGRVLTAVFKDLLSEQAADTFAEKVLQRAERMRVNTVPVWEDIWADLEALKSFLASDRAVAPRSSGSYLAVSGKGSTINSVQNLSIPSLEGLLNRLLEAVETSIVIDLTPHPTRVGTRVGSWSVGPNAKNIPPWGAALLLNGELSNKQARDVLRADPVDKTARGVGDLVKRTRKYVRVQSERAGPGLLVTGERGRPCRLASEDCEWVVLDAPNGNRISSISKVLGLEKLRTEIANMAR